MLLSLPQESVLFVKFWLATPQSGDPAPGGAVLIGQSKVRWPCSRWCSSDWSVQGQVTLFQVVQFWLVSPRSGDPAPGGAVLIGHSKFWWPSSRCRVRKGCSEKWLLPSPLASSYSQSPPYLIIQLLKCLSALPSHGCCYTSPANFPWHSQSDLLKMQALSCCALG